MNKIRTKLKQYWPLIKSMQTALLTVTGIAGYMSARCPFTHWTTMTGLVASLLLSISGSTVLNMWYDRDIDSVMNRTHHRPIASGVVSAKEALLLGLVLSAAGVGLAALLSPLYGLLIFATIYLLKKYATAGPAATDTPAQSAAPQPSLVGGEY